MIFRFKVQIKGITKPAVWRKIAVPADFTFLRFHHVIQAVFGWEDYHLFEFTDKECQNNIRISVPVEDDFFDPDFFAGTLDASKVRLSDIFSDDVREFFYVYDFGDGWVHGITLESTAGDSQKGAVCLSGKGVCPPEDCGGIYGYGEMKDVFRTMPDGDQADEYRDWLGLDAGDIWDADFFDMDEVNDCLKGV